MRVFRYPENPLLTPADVSPSRPDFEVVCVFNAGAVRHRDEIILLLRVAERAVGDEKFARVPILNCDSGDPCLEVCEFDRRDPRFDFSDPRIICASDRTVLTTISHLRVARSSDGRHFTVEPTPALFPDRPSESFGLEDPRITRIGGTHYITYKSVSSDGICTSLATTRDFVGFEKRGIIFCPENLDVCIFPQEIGGRYAALHRPVPRYFGAPSMWVAYSPDLHHWGDHRFLLGVRPGEWDSGRVGGGAVPFLTNRGWLEIYHAATSENVYCLGALLLDRDEPHRILAKSAEPILKPEAPYETEGLMPNVVFTCGAIADGDTVCIYYGAADTVIAAVEMSIEEILGSLTPV